MTGLEHYRAAEKLPEETDEYPAASTERRHDA
jgi:hypothetical protein